MNSAKLQSLILSQKDFERIFCDFSFPSKEYRHKTIRLLLKLQEKCKRNQNCKSIINELYKTKICQK